MENGNETREFSETRRKAFEETEDPFPGKTPEKAGGEDDFELPDEPSLADKVWAIAEGLDAHYDLPSWVTTILRQADSSLRGAPEVARESKMGIPAVDRKRTEPGTGDAPPVRVWKVEVAPTYTVQVGRHFYEMSADADSTLGICTYIGPVSEVRDRFPDVPMGARQHRVPEGICRKVLEIALQDRKG